MYGYLFSGRFAPDDHIITISAVLGRKLRAGTSKTKRVEPVQLDLLCFGCHRVRNLFTSKADFVPYVNMYVAISVLLKCLEHFTRLASDSLIIYESIKLILTVYLKSRGD